MSEVEARDSGSRSRNTRGTGPIQKLSPRELAVVEASVIGTPMKLICDQLSISLQAVSTYLARAKRKLSVTSRAGLHRLVAEPTPPGEIGSDLSRLLTIAELQIAGYILSGASNAVIARHRGVSVRTVENQIASIFRKLRVTSRFDLMSRARKAV